MKHIKTILKILTIIALIITLLVSGYIIYFIYIPSQPNATISKAQLERNIDSIARSYKSLRTDCEIWDEDDKWRFEDDNIPIIDNMNENQLILYISGGDSIYEDMSFREVYGIFESWLFVKDKKMSYEVIAICWSYSIKGIFTADGRTTIITKPEFEAIYGKTDISGLTREQAAKALAHKWIEETGYTKGFSLNIWKEYISERGYMIGGLLAEYDFVGMTKDEVVELLGDKGLTVVDNTLRYETGGVTYEDEFLQFTFDENEIITDVRLIFP